MAPNVRLCQEGLDSQSDPVYALKYYEDLNQYFTLTGPAPLGPIGTYKHGQTFTIALGAAGLQNQMIDITAEASNAEGGARVGDAATVTIQPYKFVCQGYGINQFFHEPTGGKTWAIGDDENGYVCILSSSDYFDSFIRVYCWPASFFDSNDYIYRSIYVDQSGYIIVGARPSPLISKDGGQTFNPLNFQWNNPTRGILCPLWNITELENQSNPLMVISEYGSAKKGEDVSDCGTYWSTDLSRDVWTTRLVQSGFDKSDPYKFMGEFRHIHGYHINPYLHGDQQNVHLMFLGDNWVGRTAGYYVSLDGGDTWSDEILNQYEQQSMSTIFNGVAYPFPVPWTPPARVPYNGPCFVTWWGADGRAFITSDTGEMINYPTNTQPTIYMSFWWSNGPQVGATKYCWGAPGLVPAIELCLNVDPDAGFYECP